VRKPEGKGVFARFRFRSAAAAMGHKAVSRLFVAIGNPIFPLVVLGVSGRIIIKQTLKTRRSVECSDVAQNVYQWRAAVEMAGSIKCKEFLD
jgi:hypothetical protein